MLHAVVIHSAGMTSTVRASYNVHYSCYGVDMLLTLVLATANHPQNFWQLTYGPAWNTLSPGISHITTLGRNLGPQ